MDRTEPPTFGALLRRYRLLAGLSQEALAERAQLSTRAVSALEQRLDRAPRAATLALLADALALSEEARAALVDAAQQSAWASRQAGVACHAEREQSAPLVGRAPELALLEGHLGGAGPPLLLLAGEPGIGKSRLLQEAARRAVARQGWQVLQGGCQRGGGQEPYAPLLQALQRHIVSQPAAQATRGSARLCLAGAAAARAGGRPHRAAAGLDAAARAGAPPDVRGGGTLPDQCGGTGGHAAGARRPAVGGRRCPRPARHAGAAPLGLPVRLVGAYRDTEVRPADPLAMTLADLAQAGLVGAGSASCPAGAGGGAAVA